MARATAKKPRQTKKARTPALRGEAKAAYTEVQNGVKNLGKSISEIQRIMQNAERRIQADARARIQALRKDARGQLRGLTARQREASRMLREISRAAGDSWRDVKRTAEGVLADARATATSVIERFRSAVGV
jgi:hypothetical protein